MIMEIILMICGVFWVGYSFITYTNNIKSSIIFKVVPFFTGFITTVHASIADINTWINNKESACGLLCRARSRKRHLPII